MGRLARPAPSCPLIIDIFSGRGAARSISGSSENEFMLTTARPWVESCLERFRERNRRLNERFFPPSLPRYGTRFRQLVEAFSADTQALLHLGAGDVDLEPLLNGNLPKPRLFALDMSQASLCANQSRLRVCGDAGILPLPSDSIDLIVSEHVFEHFPHPLDCLRECFRVLKSGGKLLVSGPNGWSYIALAARLSPLHFHNLIRRLGTPSAAQPVDGFPTFYRFSSPKTMRRLARKVGFQVISLETFVGEPYYTTFLPLLHSAFIAYHLILEKLLPVLNTHITAVVVLQKPLRKTTQSF